MRAFVIATCLDELKVLSRNVSPSFWVLLLNTYVKNCPFPEKNVSHASTCSLFPLFFIPESELLCQNIINGRESPFWHKQRKQSSHEKIARKFLAVFAFNQVNFKSTSVWPAFNFNFKTANVFYNGRRMGNGDERFCLLLAYETW